MPAWDNIPNAKHIDAVLAHVKQHPDRWRAAYAAARDAAWYAARDAAWYAARDATYAAIYAAARDAARDAAWDAAGDAAYAAAYAAAWGGAQDACAALVAWDDAGLMLGLPADAVRLFAGVGNHAAILMLPAVLAMNETTGE